MKMRIPVRRSCISLIILSALVEAIRANENETSTVEGRSGRVTGRIVKVYSGYKPDPVLCTEEGFKADPVQCSIFYRCLHSSSGKFTVFKFQCGPGTVYDPETEVCNHPSSTKRSECGGINLHVAEDNDNDIEQNELPSPISTSAPVYTSAPYNITEYTTYKVPSLSTSGVYTPSMENGYLNNFLTTSSPYLVGTTTNVQQMNPWTGYKTTTQQKLTSSTSIAPILGKNQLCTSEGFMGDRENCKFFYRCVSNLRGGFIRYEFVCSEPTVWDDHMQSCNHPWAVRSLRCGRGGIYSENYTQTSPIPYNMSAEQTDVPYSVQLSGTSNLEDNGINKQGETSVNYGDKLHNFNENSVENNQVNYGLPLGNYQTVSNNDKTKETDSSTYVENLSSSYQSGEKVTSMQSIYYTTKSTESSITQFPQSGRKFICTQSGFVGDPFDCKKFYRCVENGKGRFTKYEFSCSQGTVWDKNIEACNHAWAVKECGGALAVDRFTSSSSSSTKNYGNNFDNGYIYSSNQEREPASATTFSTPVSTYKSTINLATDSTAKTHTTTFLIRSTTPESIQNNFDFNDAYGHKLQQDTDSSNPFREKTTSSPIINNRNDCQSVGFMGDPNDCKKFYRCVDNGQGGFIKHEFSCGDGTVWDSEIEACNHAWAVKHCGSIPLRDEVTSSSVDNIHLSTTIHDFGVTTATLSSTSEKDISDYNSGYGQQQSVSTKKPYITETTTIKQIHGQKNKCTMAGFMGEINNCNKFYRCVDNGNGGFIQYEFSCGEGTVWDPDIEACNHAWAVKHCGGIMTSTEKFSTSSSTQINKVEANNEHVTNNNNVDSHSTSVSFVETTTSPSSTTTLTTVMNTGGDECVSSGFMGDSNDCQKFYRCVDNGNGGFIKHEFMCGEGTVWDSKIEACNHKWAVEKCGGSSHTEVVKTTTQTSQHTSQSTSAVTESAVTSTASVTHSSSTTSKTTSTSMKPLPSHDNKACTSEGYFANLNDCKKFYRCVDEDNGEYTKYEFSCAEGTAWDVTIQSCNYISEVKACHSNKQPITTATETMHDEPITESDAKKTTTSTTSASTAFETTTSSSVATPSTTSVFTTSAATALASTTENAKPGEQNNCNEEGYFGDKNDCKKFYRCVYENEARGYTKYDFTCADGTIWDQDLITCNHPRDVKNPSCKTMPENTSTTSTSSTTTENNEQSSSSSSSSSTTTTTTSTEKPISTTSETHSNKNDTDSNSSTSTTESPKRGNFTCSKAGFYANPNDCKKFYRCVDWENDGSKFSIYHFECGDGTIWDPALETCNHEDSVYPPRNCNNNQQQNGNTSTTSSTSGQMTSTTSKPSESTTQSTTQTTQVSTTEKPTTQSTTQSTTTGASTTQASTTESSTTQTSTTQSSTEESTTQTSTTQSTTEESTTQTSTTQSTTDESTTQTSTTQSSTEESTTQTSTTQLSTTEDSTTQTSTTQSTTTDESTTQTSTTQSTTTDESTTQSSTTEESTTQLSTTQESTTQSSTTEESTKQPSTTQSSTTQDSTTSTTNEQTTTTTQMTTTATDQTSVTTENSSESTTETSSNKECPDTANDQSLYVCPTSFKRHPKYCNLFYQCTEDDDSHELKIAVFNCPNNTIYDESKVQCVPENKSSKKCNGQISQNYRVKRLSANQNAPYVVTKESMACKHSGYFPFENQTECSPSLLKCELAKSGILRGFVYRCPDGYVYWNISRRCEPIRKVRDCKGSDYPWKRRYDIPLERFNVSP